MPVSKQPVVVLISGSGSNLQALIDAAEDPQYPAQIVAVISNKDGVRGLQRATDANIPVHVLNHRQFDTREAFDAGMIQLIDQYQPKLVALAGFMRILSEAFVEHYCGRLINIHPALLPKFKGLDTHQRALDAGESEHGATVHFVTPELDDGPLIIQARVSVLADDSAQSLAARVLEQEHLIYPQAVKLVCSGRILMHKDGRCEFDGQPLLQPLSLTDL